MAAVKLIYDPDADAAFVYLVDDVPSGGASRSIMCDLAIREGAVILLFDSRDRLLGFELLGASRLLPQSILGRDTPPDREPRSPLE